MRVLSQQCFQYGQLILFLRFRHLFESNSTSSYPTPSYSSHSDSCSPNVRDSRVSITLARVEQGQSTVYVGSFISMLNSRERKAPRTPGLEEYTASLPSWQRPICAKPYPASSSWNPNSAESMDIPVCIVLIFTSSCLSRYSDVIRFCFASLRRRSLPNRRPLAELRFMLSRQTKQKLLSTFRRRLILTLLHTSNILSTFYFAHIYYPILHCAFKVTPRCSISGHIFLLHMYVYHL